MYAVKEIFFSLQGEGFHAGRPAVFARFSGCNLWSGRELDRLRAICGFCDTDFVGTDGQGGGHYGSEADLARVVAATWPGSMHGRDKPLCVLTGGEPMLQVKPQLVFALKAQGFEVAIETNGTIAVPDCLDWIAVSPKGNATVVQRKGHELKLVYPQVGINPAFYLGWDFRYRFLQPKDDGETEINTRLAIDYIRLHPSFWRLSEQRHKRLGLP